MTNVFVVFFCLFLSFLAEGSCKNALLPSSATYRRTGTILGGYNRVEVVERLGDGQLRALKVYPVHRDLEGRGISLAKNEVAAFEFDQMLELGVVPHTELVQTPAQIASWQELKLNTVTRGSFSIQPPVDGKVAFLGTITANVDWAKPDNTLVELDRVTGSPTGKQFAPDNGMAFPETEPERYYSFPQTLEALATTSPGPDVLQRFERLSEIDLRNKLGPLLNHAQMTFFLRQRTRYLEAARRFGLL